MPSDTTSASPGGGTSVSEVVDQERQAAAGTRRTALWVATALAAIPALGIITSLVRDPGDPGFDSGYLAAGIAFAAIGGVIALMSFAFVLTPVPLDDDKLQNFTMTRVPGSRRQTYPELQEDIERVRDSVVAEENAASESTREEAEAKKMAEVAEAEALRRESMAKGKDPKSPEQQAADRGREDANRLAALARAASAVNASNTAELQFDNEQFQRREQLRSEAFLLKASDVVRRRFFFALFVATPVSVAAIALGLYFLARAPNKKTEPAAPTTLVTLQLNPAGQQALGCTTTTTLRGLRVGGTDDKPTVITFPVQGCEAKVVEFQTSNPDYGNVQPEKPIQPSMGS